MAGALDADSLDASLTPPPQTTMEALLSAGEGRVILSACRPDQKSYFTTGAEHTLFAQALLRGLAGEGEIANRNGYISVADLYDYVYEQVSTGVKVISPLVSQEPVLTVREQVGPFRVALFKGSESHTLDADTAQAIPEPAGPDVHRITAEQAREAREIIIAGRDVYHGAYGGINFHGSANISNSALIGGDSKGPISIVSSGDSGAGDLDKVFAEALRRAKELPADDQEIVTPVIQQAQIQAKAIQQGNPSPDAESILEKRLKNLVSMAPDIADVVLASLVSPAAGITAVIQKIAARVKATT